MGHPVLEICLLYHQPREVESLPDIFTREASEIPSAMLVFLRPQTSLWKACFFVFLH